MEFLTVLLIVMMFVTPVILSIPVDAKSKFQKVKKVKNGALIDLNGDKKKDKITYKVSNADSYGYEKKLKVTVNGKSLEVSDVRAIGVYVGDLKKSDKYKELFLCMRYENIIYDWTVIRYDGTKLYKAKIKNYDSYNGKYLKSKCIWGRDANQAGNKKVGAMLSVDGKGNLKIKYDTYMLSGTYTYTKKLSLGSGFTIKEKIQKNVLCETDMTGTVSNSFRVYSDKSKTAEVIWLNRGERVKILETALGNGWIKIERLSDGKLVWLYRQKKNGSFIYGPDGSDMQQAISGLPAWG